MNPVFSFITGLLGGENGPLAKLINLIPDANARAAAKEAFEKEAMELCAQASLGQLEINKQEAASSSVFVAGWRPAIGWICGFALAWQFILQPLICYGLSVYSTYSHQAIPPPPILETGQLYTVLLGMLGLGGMRTFEKVNGVARDGMDEPSKSPNK
jgi:hypothetical protein